MGSADRDGQRIRPRRFNKPHDILGICVSNMIHTALVAGAQLADRTDFSFHRNPGGMSHLHDLRGQCGILLKRGFTAVNHH